MSTIRKNEVRYIVTSNLGELLRERALSQQQLAVMTGIAKEVISKIRNRGVIRRIDCAIAVRICEALSSTPTLPERKKKEVRFDALFPLKAV